MGWKRERERLYHPDWGESAETPDASVTQKRTKDHKAYYKDAVGPAQSSSKDRSCMQMFEYVRQWLFHPEWGEHAHCTAAGDCDDGAQAGGDYRLDGYTLTGTDAELPGTLARPKLIKDHKAKYKDKYYEEQACR